MKKPLVDSGKGVQRNEWNVSYAGSTRIQASSHILIWVQFCSIDIKMFGNQPIIVSNRKSINSVHQIERQIGNKKFTHKQGFIKVQVLPKDPTELTKFSVALMFI